VVHHDSEEVVKMDRLLNVIRQSGEKNLLMVKRTRSSKRRIDGSRQA
jgi:hypothetical protein